MARGESIVSLTAFSGLDSLSIQTNSISTARPSTVTGNSPAARASSSAIIAPFRIPSPVRLAGQEDVAERGHCGLALPAVDHELQEFIVVNRR
ncbi:MAG: hypothetical protein QF926_14520 [Alphaproteobacteria bacterium]|jgi:hypothetical protein|nr:hypothetical protein [Alphaproteobacteria bacterium]